MSQQETEINQVKFKNVPPELKKPLRYWIAEYLTKWLHADKSCDPKTRMWRTNWQLDQVFRLLKGCLDELSQKEPRIHSGISDMLPDHHVNAFSSLNCSECNTLVHAGNNENMRPWVECGNGNYCFDCFGRALYGEKRIGPIDQPFDIEHFALRDNQV